MSICLPEKQDVAKQLLKGGSLYVHLDPRVADVNVPPWLRHQAQLVLQVGFDMPIPIPDLKVDDVGLYGTLSFSRNPFTCVVPWSAVFALVGDAGRGMVWPESMPAEIASEVEREAERTAKERAEAPAIPPLPAIKESAAKTPKTPTRLRSGREVPPWLRVVK